MDDGSARHSAAKALRDWLIDEAGFLEGPPLVLEGLCSRLVAIGLPLARATAHIRVVHSERIGMTSVWRRGKPTHEQPFAFGPRVQEVYQQSPVRVVNETRQRVELRPADPSAAAYGITPDLKAEGITHYVAFPLLFAGGDVNAASFATDEPRGFEPAELELIDFLLPALARVMEIKGLLRAQRELLEIYVGRVPAQRILAGQIRRGNVVELDAAILLTDLRGSTRLVVELDEGAYVRMLNRYFDCVVEAVTQSGGEVLKFVGDAVLAVFSGAADKGDGSHCDDALAAAEAIRAALADVNARDPVPGGPLESAMALHEGRLAFGNVGAVARQDFTVIGPDVNLVTRLCSLSAELDEPLLVSERFAARVPRAMRNLGEFPLKGFAGPQRVLAPASFAPLAAARPG